LSTAAPRRCLRRRDLLAAAAGWVAAGQARADLPALIASAKASVLPLGTYNLTDSPRFGFRGTGFVVGDGTLIATNFHVLPPGADAESGPKMGVLVSRTSESGQVRMARVVNTDRIHDLALLQLAPGPALPALTLDAAGAAREGQSIAILGYPIGGTLGYATVTHRGIVASVTTVALPAMTAQTLDARAIARLRGGNFEVLQLDATAYPGNSGGPVLDADTGRVLGILNMVLVKGSRESALSAPTGISYAIPIQHLISLLAEPR
jgi:S1-C subfamily serine protease